MKLFIVFQPEFSLGLGLDGAEVIWESHTHQIVEWFSWWLERIDVLL